MISVVIPCKSTSETADVVGQQVWYTIASAVSNLETLGEPYEIVVVMNGEYPMAASLTHEHSAVKVIFAGPAVDSPQTARNLGARSCSGDVLFFLDAHVVLPPGFFATMLADMRAVGADFIGAAHRFIGQNAYAFRVAWDEYLWGGDVVYIRPSADPFRVASHAHGAFAVTRAAWDRAGGYWNGISGFGGEEPQFCFKLWLLGMECWVTPRTYHWHWLSPGDRRGNEIFEDRRFVRNFLMLAAAYSDEKQVRDSYAGFVSTVWQRRYLHSGLVEEVLADPVAAEERTFIKRTGKYGCLRELREMFNLDGVLN